MKLFIFHLGSDEWDGRMAAVAAVNIDAAKAAMKKDTGYSWTAWTDYTELEAGEVYTQG